MSKEEKFMYKSAKNLKGKEVMQLFEKYNVYEDIMECYALVKELRNIS